MLLSESPESSMVFGQSKILSICAWFCNWWQSEDCDVNAQSEFDIYKQSEVLLPYWRLEIDSVWWQSWSFVCERPFTVWFSEAHSQLVYTVQSCHMFWCLAAREEMWWAEFVCLYGDQVWENTLSKFGLLIEFLRSIHTVWIDVFSDIITSQGQGWIWLWAAVKKDKAQVQIHMMLTAA